VVCVKHISSKPPAVHASQVDSYESVESATSQVSPTKDDSFDEGTRSYLLPAPPLISAFQDLAQQASPRPVLETFALDIMNGMNSPQVPCHEPVRLIARL